jgi:serine phosphatase RsbU (regulator of sigma subunit)
MSTFKRLFLVFFVLLSAGTRVSSQSFDYNSAVVKKALTHVGQDTSRVRLLNEFAYSLENSNLDSAILISNESLALSQKLSWQEGIASAECALGVFYDDKGDKAKAFALEDSALASFSRLNLPLRIANADNVLGNLYAEQSDHFKALLFYQKALDIYIRLNARKKMGDIYNNVGLVYDEQGNFTKAAENYFKALAFYDETKQRGASAAAYTNLGNLYSEQSNSEKAFEYHLKALEIDKEMGKGYSISLDYSNLGNLYLEKREEAKSLAYFFEALALDKEMDREENVGNCYLNIGTALTNVFSEDSAGKGCSYKVRGKLYFIEHKDLLDSAFIMEGRALRIGIRVHDKIITMIAEKNLGDVYVERKDFPKAFTCLHRALQIADSIGAQKEKMVISGRLSKALIKDKKYPEAIQYMQEFYKLRDTLFGKEKARLLGRQEAQFDFDKKLMEQKRKDEVDQAISRGHSKQQKLIIAAVSVGFLAVLIFWFLMYKRFRVARRQQQIIVEQKKEVDLAYAQLNDTHGLLREKTKEITDSINYARRIQQAILPDLNEIEKSFVHGFVLFKPKDIVSGDFYWFAKKEGKLFIACADCTGHGVPGGFMSMIGMEKLNEALAQSTDVSVILRLVNQNIRKAMRQSDNLEATRDGMDIALCALDRGSNRLEFAGANRPLWIIRKDNLLVVEEFKPDKAALGGLTDDKREFTKQTFELEAGDKFYLFSDGYADQFGKTDKKLMTRQFRSVLLAAQHESMTDQGKHLDVFLEDWRGRMEQTDDILVIGIEV